jgi:hypothetical protein
MCSNSLPLQPPPQVWDCQLRLKPVERLGALAGVVEMINTSLSVRYRYIVRAVWPLGCCWNCRGRWVGN